MSGGFHRPVTRTQKLSTETLLRRVSERLDKLTAELTSADLPAARAAQARAELDAHTASVARFLVEAQTWRDRRGRTVNPVTKQSYKPARLSADVRRAGVTALERALADLGASPAELAGNDLRSVAGFMMDSLLESGALRSSRQAQFDDVMLGGLIEALVRRVVLSHLPADLAPTAVAAIEGSGLRRAGGGPVVTGKVSSWHVYLLSRTRLGAGRGKQFADHTIMLGCQLVDGSSWDVPLFGVEVKAPGVVQKAAPQVAKQPARLADLLADGFLNGVDEQNRSVSIPAGRLLENPDLSGIGLAPRGRWLKAGAAHRDYSTRAGGSPRVVRVYDATIDEKLVRSVVDAVVSGWDLARRSAQLRTTPQILGTGQP
ncbi:hypothetical protein ACI784_09125 [Geodermatophilus sp. SYSU D01186]